MGELVQCLGVSQGAGTLMESGLDVVVCIHVVVVDLDGVVEGQ